MHFSVASLWWTTLTVQLLSSWWTGLLLLLSTSATDATVSKLLHEFQDISSDKLPQSLPSVCDVEHYIHLEGGKLLHSNSPTVCLPLS